MSLFALNLISMLSGEKNDINEISFMILFFPKGSINIK